MPYLNQHLESKLPNPYKWLAYEYGPEWLIEALDLYDVREVPGPESNDRITGWAQELADSASNLEWLTDVYTDDGVPWCGLFVAICVHRAGYVVFPKLLSARAWANWGMESKTPELGDVLVFWRGSPDGWQGHTAFYVGEDASAYHCLGGNQSDRVCITRITKDRLITARRPVARPSGRVRRVFLDGVGDISKNEA